MEFEGFGGDDDVFGAGEGVDGAEDGDFASDEAVDLFGEEEAAEVHVGVAGAGVVVELVVVGAAGAEGLFAGNEGAE